MEEETEQVTVEAAITIEEARALLDQEVRERVQRCSQAINAVLEQYQCQIGAQAYLTSDGRIAARIQFAPR